MSLPLAGAVADADARERIGRIAETVEAPRAGLVRAPQHAYELTARALAARDEDLAVAQRRITRLRTRRHERRPLAACDVQREPSGPVPS